MPFKDSRLGVGTLKIGPASPPVNEFNFQVSACRLTPSVDSEDGTPTLAVPAPAPLSTITLGVEHRRDPGLRGADGDRQLLDGQQARRALLRVGAENDAS